MELSQLQALITRSTLLTGDERTYWLGTLPTMNPGQIEKLVGILLEAESVPLKESVHQYFEALKQMPSKIPVAS